MLTHNSAVLFAKTAQFKQEFLTADFADATDGKEILSEKPTFNSSEYRLCRMAQVLVQKNEWHEQIPRNVGARRRTLMGKMGGYHEFGLPFPAVGHASGNYSQLVETFDVILVMPEQGEQRVNCYVSSQDKASRLHSSGAKEPSEWYVHT